MTFPARSSAPLLLHGRSQQVLDALKDAGIIGDGDYVRRVVIDINVTSAVIVHVERYGDERLIDVIRTMRGVEVRGVPADTGIVVPADVFDELLASLDTPDEPSPELARAAERLRVLRHQEVRI